MVFLRSITFRRYVLFRPSNTCYVKYDLQRKDALVGALYLIIIYVRTYFIFMGMCFLFLIPKFIGTMTKNPEKYVMVLFLYFLL